MNKVKISVVAVVSLLLSVGFTQLQEKDYGLCRAQRISGKLVFMNAEPVEDYEVVFTVKAFYMFAPETAIALAEPVVKKALNENKEFDAIIMNAGKQHIAVKFKKQ